MSRRPDDVQVPSAVDPVGAAPQPAPPLGGAAAAPDRAPAGRRVRAATGLLAVAVGEAAVTVAAVVAAGLSWDRVVDLLIFSNTLLGVSLAAAGWPIARHQPHNLVGWSLLLGGCTYAFTGTGMAVLAWAASEGFHGAGWRVVATAVNALGWSWAVALFVPLALVLFPDGRLPGRRWRWFVAFLVGDAVLLTAAAVLDPAGGLTALVGFAGYPAWSGFREITWLVAGYTAGLAAGYVGALAAVAVRYRRGDDSTRRQVLWLLLALVVMVAAFTTEALLQTDSLLLGILPLLLVPLAISIAVLRHQLVDIRLVVSRTLVYVVLTAGVVAGYLALVVLLDATVRSHVSVSSSLLATLLVALAVNPVRLWLHRVVHRALYGARGDPVAAFEAVGTRLRAVGSSDTTGDGLADVLAELCRVLRLPAAALIVDEAGGRRVAAHATLPPERHAVALRAGGGRVGELVVGLRPGERRLAAADERLLELLAAPMAVAVQAGQLADELARSRERVISGREEERRRIRRELHDGVGPVLTGVLLNADAARRLLGTDPARSAELLADLRDQTIGAIEEIRRLAYDLRPPALDGLGLTGALHEYAALLSRGAGEGALTVTVEAVEPLDELPAAVEVAAYRIATEALTNVVRHSTASAAVVRLAVEDGSFRLQVVDDGVGTGEGWQPGVGLTSIRERTAELGGESEIRHDRSGGLVRVRLPLAGGPVARTDASAAGATVRPATRPDQGHR